MCKLSRWLGSFFQSSFTKTGVLWTAIVLTAASPLESADPPWLLMKSAHFEVISNAGEGSTRSVTWQLEQIRAVISALWPWARFDLTQPLSVIAVKDENSMRALAPAFWERKTGVRPSSVWVGGANRSYLAIRADLHGDDRALLNPYITAYHSYAALVIQSSMAHPFPLWLSRGLAGVISNTIVRENAISIGPAIPWHLQRLRGSSRLPLSEVLAVTNGSPELSDGDRLSRFEAQSWALVHYLMFGNEGRRRAQLDQLMAFINSGKEPAAAVKETIGNIQDLEGPLKFYVEQVLFPMMKVSADLSVKREAFAVRPMPPAESSSARAAFHIAMRRPLEARTLVDEARQADPNAPWSYSAEGLLFDRDDKPDEARKAFAAATEHGSTDAYAYYRLARLELRGNPDRDTLTQVEQHAKRATELNDRFALAYSLLADARSALDPKTDGATPLVRRAIALEPLEPNHRLAAARVLWRRGNYADALAEARAALALSRNDQERAAAQDAIRGLEAAAR
jgi:tetratricopeptide (TPR) repeat protein